MSANLRVDVDVRNLFSVRVVKFDVVAGPPKQVDITFELQSDKTRATMRVAVAYGKFPTAELADGSGVLMSAVRDDGELKEYDIIKQAAWDVVMHTTESNKVRAAGTHADASWDDIKAWASHETMKPSISQTINTL